jgi:hypothetical protein
MLVCAFLYPLAHEIAGAACTRLSLLPLLSGGGGLKANATLGHFMPRDRAGMSSSCLKSEQDQQMPDVNQRDGCFALAAGRALLCHGRAAQAHGAFLSVRLTFELSQSRQLVRCQSFNRFSVISWYSDLPGSQFGFRSHGLS